MSNRKKLKLKNLNAHRKKNKSKHVVKIEKVASKNDMTVLGVARARSKGKSGINQKPGDTSQPASPMQSFRIIEDPFKVKVGVGWSLDDKGLSESRSKSSAANRKLTQDFPTPDELEINSSSTKSISNTVMQSNDIPVNANLKHSKNDELMQKSRSSTFNHTNRPEKVRADPNPVWAGDSYNRKTEVQQGAWKRNTNRVAVIDNSSVAAHAVNKKTDTFWKDGGKRKEYNHGYYRRDSKFLTTPNGRSPPRQSDAETSQMNERVQSRRSHLRKVDGWTEGANQFDTAPLQQNQSKTKGDEVVELNAEKYEKRNIQGKKIFDPRTGNMINASDVARSNRDSNRKINDNNHAHNRKPNNTKVLRKKERSNGYNSKQLRKRHVSIDDEEERKRLENKIERSMNNVISPVDAEDEQDDSEGNRVPKILERLKLMNKEKRSGKNSKGKARQKIRDKRNVDAGHKNKNRAHQHATSHKKKIFDPVKNKVEDVSEPSKKASKTESKNFSKKGSRKKITKFKKKKDEQPGRNNQISEDKNGHRKMERKLHNKRPETKEKPNRSSIGDANEKATKRQTTKTKKESKRRNKEQKKKKKNGDDKIQTKPTHDNRSPEVTYTDKICNEKADIHPVTHDKDRLQEQENSSAKSKIENDRTNKVPKKVLKVWGSSESELELSDSNFSAESSPSWQSQPTWGSSGGGGYFDALFANGSTSPKGISLVSPTSSEDKAHKKAYQEDYLLSLNMMMGNMQFNNVGMLQKHSTKSVNFEGPRLATGNESREKNNLNDNFNGTSASHQTVNDENDDDDSSAKFDESKLIGTFLDSPKITTLRDTEEVGKDCLDL